MKTKTRAVRIKIDMSVGFNRLFDTLPITRETASKLTMVVAQFLANEGIGVTDLLAGGDTKLSLDMRYRTLPPPDEATKGPDVPLSKLRKLGLPR